MMPMRGIFANCCPRARVTLTAGHDTFEPHLAGMGEDGRAVAFDMLVEPDTRASLGHDRRERGLADLERVTAQVIAVQLDEVEGVEEHVPVMLAVKSQTSPFYRTSSWPRCAICRSAIWRWSCWRNF
jgi:hypothetical protein